MSSDNKIFEFIKSNDNSMLSQMSGNDIQDLIVLLNHYYIEYRDELGLDNDTTFGLELEFERVRKADVEKFLYDIDFYSWDVKGDMSLRLGSEINTPILRDSPYSWESLKKVCDYVSKKAVINKRCGGHIHIGAHVIENKLDTFLNFIKLWSCYENIIYRFSCGDYLSSREGVLKYARPMASEYKNDYNTYCDLCENVFDLAYYLSCGKHKAINFDKMSRNMDSSDSFKKDNTIEFRCPNGTLNPIIWQNNVNVFVKMLYYSKSSKFDNDLLLERINKNNYIYNLNSPETLKIYNEIFIDQALEFCDIVFDNNLDKINFLKQYFKNFKVSKNIRSFTKAKRMTK